MPLLSKYCFFVIDTCGGMYGKKIGMVNSAMERAIEFLKTTRKKSGDYIQKMAILKVNTNCQWCEEYGPEAVANYKFENLEAGGLCDWGAALSELDNKLNPREFLIDDVPLCRPIIVFMFSDRSATDDYKKSLEKLSNNRFFKLAIKVAIALTDAVDYELLKDIVSDTGAWLFISGNNRANLLGETLENLMDASIKLQHGLVPEDRAFVKQLIDELSDNQPDEIHIDNSINSSQGSYAVSETCKAMPDYFMWNETGYKMISDIVVNSDEITAPRITAGTLIKLQNGIATATKIITKDIICSLYAVDYHGENKILKWIERPNKEDYKVVSEIATSGFIDDNWILPEDVTPLFKNGFGYILPQHDDAKDYYPISDFMSMNVKFSSYHAMVDACINIVSAFCKLHGRGLVRYGWDDSILVNPINGKVRIASNGDDIVLEGVHLAWLECNRVSSPEIVLGGSNQHTMHSERHIMAVFLFEIMCLGHPLEGMKYLVLALTPTLSDRLYGSEPVFIMDPENKENGPYTLVQQHLIKRWQRLPGYIKEMFVRVFGYECLHNPAARPSEMAWLRVLTRLRSEIIMCSCGNELFLQNGEPCKCESCQTVVSADFKLELGDYCIPAVKGSRIYCCQLRGCNPVDALTPVAVILGKKNSVILGIKNKSGQQWDAVNSKGVARKVAPDEVIPMIDGIAFECMGNVVKIRANTNRKMNIWFILQCSGRMGGEKISLLNKFMTTLLERFQHIKLADNACISVIEYATSIISIGPRPAEFFKINSLEAGGVSDAESTIIKLNELLSLQISENDAMENYIVWIGKGWSNFDPDDSSVQIFHENPVFKKSKKIGIAWINDDEEVDETKEFFSSTLTEDCRIVQFEELESINTNVNSFLRILENNDSVS